MSLAKIEQVWREAKEMRQHCHAVIEMGLLSEPARVRLLQTAYPKQALMQQTEFANLRNHGPWLLDLTSLEFRELLALESLHENPALMGWIRSQCTVDILAEHLGDALLAEDATGRVYLLRSYAPGVLPLLHARAGATWHAWLFGPLNEWWLHAPEQGWQCLPGAGLASPDLYQPIKLDDELWRALELDPLAYSLTAELEKSAAEVFSSPCHGERLAQVRQALDAGRDEGVEQMEDLSLFATLQLLDSRFPAHWTNWQQVLRRVKEQRLPLAQALRMPPE